MSDEQHSTETPATPPAKKAAAAPRRRTAKKTAAAPKDQQVIFLVGNSRGAKHGERRTVDSARAADLVKAGLARYRRARE